MLVPASLRDPADRLQFGMSDFLRRNRQISMYWPLPAKFAPLPMNPPAGVAPLLVPFQMFVVESDVDSVAVPPKCHTA